MQRRREHGEENDSKCSCKVGEKGFPRSPEVQDYETLEELLNQKKIDVDTVFEVEDENLILASYKQGKRGSTHKPGSRWVQVVFQELWPRAPPKAAA